MVSKPVQRENQRAEQAIEGREPWKIASHVAERTTILSKPELLENHIKKQASI